MYRNPQSIATGYFYKVSYVLPVRVNVSDRSSRNAGYGYWRVNELTEPLEYGGCPGNYPQCTSSGPTNNIPLKCSGITLRYIVVFAHSWV